MRELLRKHFGRPFTRALIRALIAFALMSALLGLSACGGSGDKTVATVGNSKVSQAMLSHWMRTTLGGDYRATLTATAPEGLVSDPPDYDRCVSVAARIVPQLAGKPKLSGAQLRVKCRQLNLAVKEQALSYILSVLWATEEAAELGSPASEGEITNRLRALIRNDYHSPAQFKKKLAQLRRSVADERFLVKRNVLEGKFLTRLAARVTKLGGGERTKTKLVLEGNAKWTAKTDCSPGYLAWECKQFSPSKEVSPSPAVVLEQLSTGVG